MTLELRAVRYAVGTDPDLPMLTGVLLDVDDSDVRLAATDRYRLAVSTPAGAEVTGGRAGGQLVLELDRPITPLALLDPVRPGNVSMLMPIRLP